MADIKTLELESPDYFGLSDTLGIEVSNNSDLDGKKHVFDVQIKEEVNDESCFSIVGLAQVADGVKVENSPIKIEKLDDFEQNLPVKVEVIEFNTYSQVCY